MTQRTPDAPDAADPPRATAGAAARRAGWTFADQALSSLTNFAISILIARTLGVAEFGAFAIAFATYLLIVNVARAIGTEPLIIRFSDVAQDEWRRGAASSTGVSLLTGALGSLACGTAGLIVGGTLGDALLGLALVLPGLTLQDAWRYCFFASGRAHLAFGNDLVWAAVLFPAFGAALALDRVGVLSAVVLWGGSATVAGLVGLLQARLLPRPQRAWAWWREHRDLIPAFLGELLALSGSKEAVMVGVGGIAGLAATGALRAGEVLLGPLRILFTGAQHVSVPEGVRLLHRAPHRLPAACALLSVVLAGAAALGGGALLLMPAGWGETLLDESWGPARQVLLPLTVAYAASGALRGALVGLRVLAAARRSLRARLVTAGVTVAFALAGAAFAGAVGAAWGISGASALGAAWWWWELRRTRSRRTTSPEPTAPAQTQGTS